MRPRVYTPETMGSQATGFVLLGVLLGGCSATPPASCIGCSDAHASEGGALFEAGTQPDQGATPSLALRCDGFDDEVRVSLSGLLPLGSWTLELWLRAEGSLPYGSDPQPIVSAPSNDFFDTFSLRISDWPLTSDRRLRFSAQKRLERCDGTPQSASPAAYPLLPEHWHHVAASLEIDAQKRVSQSLYLDGQHQPGGTISWLSREFPCHELSALVVCGALHPFDTIAPFVGAIDSLRLSAGIRYRSDFSPKPLTSDGSTILFLGFDTLPLVVEGAAAERAQLIVSGDPQLQAL